MWGREMRAGLAFVIAALLIGQGFREWRRSHEENFQDVIRGLTARDAGGHETARVAALPAIPDSAPARRPRPPRGVPVGRLDPNRSSALELTRLPGIGPALATRIVAERDRGGGFASAEALLRVPGIGPKTLERIRAYLSFPTATGGDSLTGF